MLPVIVATIFLVGFFTLSQAHAAGTIFPIPWSSPQSMSMCVDVSQVLSELLIFKEGEGIPRALKMGMRLLHETLSAFPKPAPPILLYDGVGDLHTRHAAEARYHRAQPCKKVIVHLISAPEGVGKIY